jgi:KDO2-lipid IV(A) lauroyltransferase
MKKKLINYCVYVFFLILGVVVRRCSLAMCYEAASWLGRLIYRKIGIRRKLVLDNLTKAFPEKTVAEIDQIAEATYQNQLIVLFETLRLPLYKTPQDIRRDVEMDFSLVHKICYDNGKGVVFAGGHFGNWELMAFAGGALDKPIFCFAKEQSNKRLTKKLDSYRTYFGNKIVYPDKAPRTAIQELKHGNPIALLADQASWGRGFYTDFFGRPAATFLGPATFALKTNTPLFFTALLRVGMGKYKTIVKQVPMDDLTHYSDENVYELTRRYTRLLEDLIREYPSQWLWLHNRWKHTPPAEVTNQQPEATVVK